MRLHVSLECRPSCKGLVACEETRGAIPYPLASVRSRALVRLAVSGKARGVAERLVAPAYTAYVWLLACVHPRVHGQRRELKKKDSSKCALLIQLPELREEDPLYKRTYLNEGLPADLAIERSFPRMYAIVSHQITLPTELLLAVSVLARMHRNLVTVGLPFPLQRGLGLSGDCGQELLEKRLCRSCRVGGLSDGRRRTLRRVVRLEI